MCSERADCRDVELIVAISVFVPEVEAVRQGVQAAAKGGKEVDGVNKIYRAIIQNDYPTFGGLR